VNQVVQDSFDRSSLFFDSQFFGVTSSTDTIFCRSGVHPRAQRTRYSSSMNSIVDLFNPSRELINKLESMCYQTNLLFRYDCSLHRAISIARKRGSRRSLRISIERVDRSNRRHASNRNLGVFAGTIIRERPSWRRHCCDNCVVDSLNCVTFVLRWQRQGRSMIPRDRGELRRRL